MITPAFAQGTAAAGDAASIFQSPLIPVVLVFVVMYFLIFRPQQRKAKEHREMLKAVRRGDVIVTAGGLVAKVTKVVDDQPEIEVEIADGVKVKLVRSMVADVRTRAEPVKAAAAKAKEAADKPKE